MSELAAVILKLNPIRCGQFLMGLTYSGKGMTTIREDAKCISHAECLQITGWKPEEGYTSVGGCRYTEGSVTIEMLKASDHDETIIFRVLEEDTVIREIANLDGKKEEWEDME